MKNINLTKEQLDILANVDGNAIIRAFAGTGKTTTLAALARSRPNIKFLYLAFNKAICEEAINKFPENVECRTINSLAYQHAGRKFGNSIRSALSIWQINGIIDDWRKSRIVINTINNFQLSAEEKICHDNIDHKGLRRYLSRHIKDKIDDELEALKDEKIINQIKKSRDEREEKYLKEYYPKFTEQCINKCREIWEIIINENDSRIAVSHNTYVKLFSVNIDPAPFSLFDYILFDEAQDSNDVIFYALANSGKPVVAVGDAHQAIYGFRGSVDSLDKFNGDEFVLSQSFRFGPDVAQLANKVLLRIKDEKVKIAGNKNINTKISPKSAFNLQSPGNKLIISRTNSKLLENALTLLQKGIKYHVIGGINKSLFSMIESVFAFWGKRPDAIKDEDVSHIYENNSSLAALEEFANDNNKPEILTAVGVVKKYKNETPFVIKKVIANNSKINECAVWLATAHKAKGMEADTVLLASDFKTFTDAKNENKEMFSLVESAAQEVNLLYVALTRCVKHLFINDCVEQFIVQDRKFLKNLKEQGRP